MTVETAGALQARPMMTIQESIVTCLRKYADFNGRATRAEFWWWVLATTLVRAAISALEGFISVAFDIIPITLFGTIFSLAILLPNLAVTARRLHDIGKSGWWQLVWIVIGVLGAIPLIAGIVVAVVAVFSGTASWGSFGATSFWLPIVVGLLVSLVIWLGLLIWWIVWLVRQGQVGPNKYGTDPRAWYVEEGGSVAPG